MRDYNPTKVQETDVKDDYGNRGYNVFFEGEDKPVFMKAKNAPEVGKSEYGVITDEAKKSGNGTYRKFTRKQREEKAESQPASTGAVATSVKFENRDDAITRQSALKSAVAVGETDPEKILKLADDFLVWLKNDVSEEAPLPEPQGEVTELDESEIDLDDIPF